MMVLRDTGVVDPTAFVDGGRQREGEGLLRRRAGPGAVLGRADPCRRFLDQLRDRRRGDEPPAAQNDARQVTRTKELVDRISGDAAQQLPCFFDRIQFAADHGVSIAVQGSVLAARKGPLPVDCHVRTGVPNVDRQRAKAKGQYRRKFGRNSRSVGLQDRKRAGQVVRRDGSSVHDIVTVERRSDGSRFLTSIMS